MKQPRPWLSWGAMLIVALLGLVAGPALLSLASAAWAALQPNTHIFGWDVVAVLGAVGMLWFLALIALAIRQSPPTRWIFVAASLGLAAIPVILTLLEPPSGQAYNGTLSPEDAQAWKNFRP